MSLHLEHQYEHKVFTLTIKSNNIFRKYLSMAIDLQYQHFPDLMNSIECGLSIVLTSE